MTQFIKIPKQLFTEPQYKNLSANAKLLYALLLDRRSLSEQNGLCDQNGKTVVYFTRKQAGEILNLTVRSAQKVFEELKACELLREKPQGVGKTHTMYVQNFPCGCTFSSDGDVQKLPTNKTEYNKTDINKTELSQSVCVTKEDSRLLSKIIFDAELEIFDDGTSELLESAITKIFYSKSLRVDGAVLSQPLLRAKLSALTGDALIRAVDRLKQKEGEIKSPSKYLVSAIVNAPDDYAADCLAGTG